MHLGKRLMSEKILESWGWEGVKHLECSGSIDGNGQPLGRQIRWFLNISKMKHIGKQDGSVGNGVCLQTW